MNTNFYGKNANFCYPELAICMEDTTGPEAKIYIPIVTPTLPNSVCYDTTGLKPNTGNILSDSDPLYISHYTESNYITMKLPDDLPAKAGDKFVIVFIGGDVNHGVLIGRYNR